MGLKMRRGHFKHDLGGVNQACPYGFSRPKVFGQMFLGRFEKKNQNSKKNLEKYLKAPKNPKNFKENLVKFSVPNSISRYIQ